MWRSMLHRQWSCGKVKQGSCFSTPTSAVAAENVYKNPVMVEAGKKAALTRATASYTFDERLEGKSEEIQELTATIREFIIGLDESIEEVIQGRVDGIK